MTQDDFLAHTMKGRAAQMSRDANSAPGLQQDPALAEQRHRLRAALGNPPQIAALVELLANERPSYFPGVEFAPTAYYEGRKAVLRELLQFLTTPENA